MLYTRKQDKNKDFGIRVSGHVQTVLKSDLYHYSDTHESESKFSQNQNVKSPSAALEEFDRVAIYFVPDPQTPIAQFGRTWFGIDPQTPCANIERRCYGLGRERAKRITFPASRYALHGTLKAPFRLRKGTDIAALKWALAEFAGQQSALSIHQMALTQMGDQLVLAPTARNDAVDRLARRCVSEFDHFRAPLNDADRQRRNCSAHTKRQKALFEEWGYPHIFDEFNFHITLTGHLDEQELAQIRPALTPALKDATSEPIDITSICLLGDPGRNENFHLIERFEFGAIA